MLESFLKEISRKTDRCETVNIIYIDWRKKKAASWRRLKQGVSNKLRVHRSGQNKDLSKGLHANDITVLQERTARGDDKWRIM